MSVFESQAAAGRPIILRKPLLVLAGLAVVVAAANSTSFSPKKTACSISRHVENNHASDTPDGGYSGARSRDLPRATH
jgi:hypothetical protein